MHVSISINGLPFFTRVTCLDPVVIGVVVRVDDRDVLAVSGTPRELRRFAESIMIALDTHEKRAA